MYIQWSAYIRSLHMKVTGTRKTTLFPLQVMQYIAHLNVSIVASSVERCVEVRVRATDDVITREGVDLLEEVENSVFC